MVHGKHNFLQNEKFIMSLTYTHTHTRPNYRMRKMENFRKKLGKFWENFGKIMRKVCKTAPFWSMRMSTQSQHRGKKKNGHEINETKKKGVVCVYLFDCISDLPIYRRKQKQKGVSKKNARVRVAAKKQKKGKQQPKELSTPHEYLASFIYFHEAVCVKYLHQNQTKKCTQ